MFAGHFGLAAVVKAKEPKVPLWALMVSTQLLDILFVPLFLAGVETIEPIGNGEGKEILIHANYTHSLVGALLIVLVAGWLAWRTWGKRSGVIIAATVFSHWILDLIVHRPDMPILPGDFGNLPLLGFGLWKWPVASLILEAVMIGLGAILYFRSALSRSKKTSTSNKKGLRIAILAGTVMGMLLILSLITDYLK